jgi:hypothetical protein
LQKKKAYVSHPFSVSLFLSLSLTISLTHSLSLSALCDTCFNQVLFGDVTIKRSLPKKLFQFAKHFFSIVTSYVHLKPFNFKAHSNCYKFHFKVSKQFSQYYAPGSIHSTLNKEWLVLGYFTELCWHLMKEVLKWDVTFIPY